MASALIGNIGYRSGATATQSDTGGEETLVFLVQTDSVNEPKQSIVAATGFGFFTPHPDDPNQLSQRAVIRNYQNEPLLFEVEFSFSSSSTQTEEEEQNPLDREVKIRVSRVRREITVWEDVNGNPLTTEAGEFFEDMPGKSVNGRRISFSKNYANQSEPSWALTHDNTLNDSAVTIKGTTYPEKTLWMAVTDIAYDLNENNVDYMRLEWELEYNPEGWDIKPVHRGYYELADDGGIVVPIKIPFTDGAFSELSFGNPTRKVPSTPWPLDGTGRAIRDPDLTPLTTKTFQYYSTADHTAMPGVT